MSYGLLKWSKSEQISVFNSMQQAKCLISKIINKIFENNNSFHVK